jgi:hypothetical protein
VTRSTAAALHVLTTTGVPGVTRSAVSALMTRTVTRRLDIAWRVQLDGRFHCAQVGTLQTVF